MNVQLLSDNQKLIKPIKDFFIKKGGFIHVESDINRFFESSIRNPSNLYFIQHDIEDLAQVLDIIKDIRVFFGAFPLVFIIGKRSSNFNPTVFLNVGADNVFISPYDMTILEDFLGHNLQRDTFFPIKYRNIPSGGSPVKIARPIILSEVNSEGIIFLSEDFITRGTIFNFNIKEFLDISTDEIKCKLISSEVDEEEEIYKYFAEYYELPNELKKQIRFCLKNNN